MSKHFFMGAIDIATNQHVYPKMAEKGKNYKCPDCDHPCIFRKGTKKAHHFAHKAKSNCSFYDKPSEGQIHKEAKRQMCVLLNQKKSIQFIRYCERSYGDKIPHDAIIRKIQKYYSETCVAKEEFSFPYNNSTYKADIALIDDNQIKFIVEIRDTHRTEEERRFEPWVEIDAEDLLDNINNPNSEFGDINDSDGVLKVTCVRSRLCDLCKVAVEYEEEQKKLKEEAKRRKEEAKRKEMEEYILEARRYILRQERYEKEQLEIRIELEQIALIATKKKEEEWLAGAEQREKDRIELIQKEQEATKQREERVKKALEKRKKEENIVILEEYEKALKAAKIRRLTDKEKADIIKGNELKQQKNLLKWLGKAIEVKIEKPLFICDFCDKLFNESDECSKHETHCSKNPMSKNLTTKPWSKYLENNYNSCQRCGSNGHHTKHCRAVCHIDGYELSEDED